MNGNIMFVVTKDDGLTKSEGIFIDLFGLGFIAYLV